MAMSTRLHRVPKAERHCEGMLARRVCAGQSFNGHCPTSNCLGACVCVGFSDLAQHNGIWALLLLTKRAFQERLMLSLHSLTATSSNHT